MSYLHYLCLFSLYLQLSLLTPVGGLMSYLQIFVSKRAHDLFTLFVFVYLQLEFVFTSSC